MALTTPSLRKESMPSDVICLPCGRASIRAVLKVTLMGLFDGIGEQIQTRPVQAAETRRWFVQHPF
eukprot:3409049-Amphidinium_carterae.1